MNGNQTRELDFRAVDGLEVALLWHTETNRLTVSVFDSKNDDDFEIEVSSSDAMDAFHHPFAYAGSSGTPVPAYA